MSQRGEYSRVPASESIEMRGAADDRAHKPAAGADEQHSQFVVVGSVVFYLVAALVMVMANKWVLNKVEVPLFMVFCQLVIAVVLLHITAVFGYFKLPRVDVTASKGVMPLIACNCLGLAFNTYCLQFVDASFYQVARGLVLPFTVGFSWFLLGTRSTPRTLLAIGLVCLGFMLGVSVESATVSLVGTAFGVASSVTTAVHAIVVKRSLPVVGGNTLDLVYYQNLLSAVVFAPFIVLTGEAGIVADMLFGVGEYAGAFGTFMWGALITGVVGFAICIAGVLSIKVTSPISHMISAAVRGVLQTFLGIWLFGDQVGTGRAAGIIFILGGSTYYVYAKSQEGAAGASKPPPQSSLSLPTHTGGAAAAAGGGGGGAPSPRVNQELFNADGSNGSGNEKDKNARVF